MLLATLRSAAGRGLCSFGARSACAVSLIGRGGASQAVASVARGLPKRAMRALRLAGQLQGPAALEGALIGRARLNAGTEGADLLAQGHSGAGGGRRHREAHLDIGRRELLPGKPGEARELLLPVGDVGLQLWVDEALLGALRDSPDDGAQQGGHGSFG